VGLLTTHVLDTANGCPAEGIMVQLYRLPEHELLLEATTNVDGRVQDALLEDDAFRQGRYELVFNTEAYFKKMGNKLSQPAFIDDVIIRFAIADEDEHYHVPLLVSPWSYSTYRGS